MSLAHITPQSCHVDLQRNAGVAVITLDDQRTRNALNAESAAALVQACDTVDADLSTGVLVVRGAHHTFCSGADRSVLAALTTAPPHTAYDALSDLYSAFARVGRVSVPTIACLEGAAVGAGLNLALATDLRIAAHDAQLVSGFAPLGIHPGGGHLHLLEQAAGRQTAAALGVFGRRVSAIEAQALGLVWSTVPASGLDQALAALTGHLAADPELSRALKTSLTLTTASLEDWAAATEVERARQLWSLSRPRMGSESRGDEGTS